MKIQTNYQSQTFTSRNPDIRQADKIMRNLMHEYPAFSTSRVKYYDIYIKRPLATKAKVQPIYWKLHAERQNLSKFEGSRRINKTLAMVKKEKNANCAEFANMARGAFLANGYKDVRIGSLKVYYPQENSILPPLMASQRADHNVLIVNAGKNAELDKPSTFSKKAFIVDPWGGFCDYVANAFNKYKGIFLRNLSPEDVAATKKFIFEEKRTMNITSRTCASMRKNHPELVV